ncbi:MAG: hydroxymethylbilane synthase [Methylococcales bacterium]|nr:hydroxymethylbilane synthase [Methylococcales bacterium]
MTAKTLRIATRKSALALWQAEHVASLLRDLAPDITVNLVPMSTRGDRFLSAPLAQIGGKGLFVKELEQGLLSGQADIAVHSMKDVPVTFPDSLHLAAILTRENPFDAFVSTRYPDCASLPANAIVGTSSLRRQCQLLARFPELQVLPLRGNVNTRLARLDQGDFDAIILAAAGLERLNFHARITQQLSAEESLPAIGQGAIGIECRRDDPELNTLLAALHDVETAACVRAERELNRILNGSCQVPIAGYAVKQDSQLILTGLVGHPDGQRVVQAQKTGHANNPEAVGAALAAQLLEQGAGEVLKSIHQTL